MNSDYEFESTWHFCSHLLNNIIKNKFFLYKLQFFRLFLLIYFLFCWFEKICQGVVSHLNIMLYIKCLEYPELTRPCLNALTSVFVYFEVMMLTLHHGKVNCDVINPGFGVSEQDYLHGFFLYMYMLCADPENFLQRGGGGGGRRLIVFTRGFRSIFAVILLC